MRYYVFNGDADGICAVQQLRLDDREPARLVTGIKRDIELLGRVDAGHGDDVFVLDVSYDRNRKDVERLLRNGSTVWYCDHHFPGEVPARPGLTTTIDESPDVCTSILVDRTLQGRHRPWAIVAAFGDNLRHVGEAMAAAAGLGPTQREELAALGNRLNYNAYGESVADLHVDPAALSQALLAYRDPLAFVVDAPLYRVLDEGYADDMARADRLRPLHRVPGATVLVLPSEPWARRAVGELANLHARRQPDDAVALLVPRAAGGYVISVRVPRGRVPSAHAFCREFPTGGGRTLAAGINALPDQDVDHFVSRFASSFRSDGASGL